jgi:septum formation protein
MMLDSGDPVLTRPENPKPRIVLASGSPRRRELLKGLRLDFRVVPADIDESPQTAEAPAVLTSRLSSAKARAVAADYPQALVIAADTVVTLDGELLEKPRDTAENRVFIQKLSGRTHEVYTGHAVMLGDALAQRTVCSRVTFRELSPREIDWYAGTGEGLDKAGGYAIQGFGAAIVKEIHGCYFNVVGLSIATLVELTRALGVELV